MLRPTIYLPTPLLERLRRTDATRTTVREDEAPARSTTDRAGPVVEPAERGAACEAVA
jgi:hypothetical protein